MKTTSIIYTFILSTIFFSCNSKKTFVLVNHIDNRSNNINLENYDLYVFKMCREYSNKLNNSRDDQKVKYPIYSICNNSDDKDSKNVVEETYLFLPRAEENDTVLYVTTFSHLYTQKKCGVFNCPEFQNKIFVEDVDGIYLGKRKNNSIVFTNSRNKTEWNFRGVKNNIEVISITDIDRSKGKQVELKNVLSLPIVFESTQRQFTYGKSDYNQDCLCPGMDKYESKYKNSKGFTITNVITDSNHFYLQNSISNSKNEYFKFKFKGRPLNFLSE